METKGLYNALAYHLVVKQKVFGLKLNDGKWLKDILKTIAIIAEEATFDVTPEGLKLRVMDPAKIAMINFTCSSKVFNEYICTNPTKVTFMPNELLKLLKKIGEKESLELALDDTTGRLVATIIGEYKRSFDIPTLEPSDEEIPTPKISFNVKAKFLTEKLKKGIEDCTNVSDNVKIEVETEGVILNARGDIAGATIEFRKGSEALKELEVSEASKTSYSLQYLFDIFSNVTSATVILELSTDLPLKMTFEQEVDAKLEVYLAPRIEVE